MANLPGRKEMKIDVGCEKDFFRGAKNNNIRTPEKWNSLKCLRVGIREEQTFFFSSLNNNTH